MKNNNRIYIKKCHYCGKEFAATHHNQGFCSDECRKASKKEYQRRYYHENIDHVKKVHAQYRIKNKEKLAAYNRQWKKNNPDKIHEQNARACQKNKEKRRQAVYQWRKDNPEKYKLYRINWERRNPEKVALYNEKSNAKKYRKRHRITEHYCQTHNDCLNCPYPYDVCLFE